MPEWVSLRDYPADTIRFVCESCGRNGEYSKQHLIWRFGPDIYLADLRPKLANCDRKGDCVLQFKELIRMPHLSRVSPRPTSDL
jgi:hypothetical protein